jgi:hypothetical protein
VVTLGWVRQVACERLRARARASASTQSSGAPPFRARRGEGGRKGQPKPEQPEQAQASPRLFQAERYARNIARRWFKRRSRQHHQEVNAERGDDVQLDEAARGQSGDGRVLSQQRP